MSSKNIDGLAPAAAIGAADKFLVAQGNALLKRTTAGDLRDFVVAGIAAAGASEIAFNDVLALLGADNVQDAIDEICIRLLLPQLDYSAARNGAYYFFL